MAVWCPKCGSEYVEGWDTCSSCGVALVDQLPAKRGAKEFTPEDAIFTEPRALRTHEDPFIAIWEGDTTEALRLSRHLEAAHIPVDLGEAAEPGQSRIEVPRSYVEESYLVFDVSGAEPAPVAAAEELDLHEEPVGDGGWSPGVRIALWVIAIGLIAALLVTSRF